MLERRDAITGALRPYHHFSILDDDGDIFHLANILERIIIDDNNIRLFAHFERSQ